MSRVVLASACCAIAAGCVLSEDPTYYPLRNGRYHASWETLAANDCFPDGIPIPRGYSLAFHTSVASDQVEVAWPELSAGLAPMLGNLDDDGSFDASGFVPYVLTTGCTLGVTTSLSGIGVSKTLVPFRLTVHFDAGTTAGNGLPSDCAALAGGTVDNLAFPVLSDPASGSCEITVKGVARYE